MMFYSLLLFKYIGVGNNIINNDSNMPLKFSFNLV